MKTVIQEAQARDVRELISSAVGETLSQADFDTFMRVVWASTQMWVGFHDGKFVCVWGLVPPTMISQQAYLWLHVTENITGAEFSFVRKSQIAVKDMLCRFPTIVGHVDRDNIRARRWIGWLGGKLNLRAPGALVPFEIKA